MESKSIYIIHKLLGVQSSGLVKLRFVITKNDIIINEAVRYHKLHNIENENDLVNKSIQLALDIVRDESNDITFFVDNLNGQFRINEELMMLMENKGNGLIDYSITSELKEYFEKEVSYLKRVPF